LNPIIFCDQLRMDFYTERKSMAGAGGKLYPIDEVMCGLSGKDRGDDGAIHQVNRQKDCGWTLGMGRIDWSDVSFALREFVSNAIDSAVQEGEIKLVQAYINDRYAKEGAFAESKEIIDEVIASYKANYSDVSVDIVEENQVRAKAGTTRVYIPVNDTVEDFQKNLGKWFLHFSEPELVNSTLLPKANRNLMAGHVGPVIYRRGVRVREFSLSNLKSLFDYNVNDLEIDESRNANDGSALASAGRALAVSDVDVIKKYLIAILTETPMWESTFGYYEFQNIAKNLDNWALAVESVFGSNVVFVGNENKIAEEAAARKGYKVVRLPYELYGQFSYQTCGRFRTIHSILDRDDIAGRELCEASESMQESVNRIWSRLESINYTFGKPCPPVSGFRYLVHAEGKTNGYYWRDGIYLNDTLGAGMEMDQVSLEEIAHHITGATDNSRDFQEFLLSVAVRWMLQESVVN